MFRPRIIPVLLYRNGGLVKSIRFTDHRYIGDPINAVRIFNDCFADELIILDIEASKKGHPISTELVREVGEEANMPFAVGGGITTLDQIAERLTLYTRLDNCRDEEELVFKLEEKFEKIRERYSIADVTPPEYLLPTLRPYHVSGFQWLNYLHDVQWGGILADDMGLGKTVQTLSFLQHLKEKNGNAFGIAAPSS